MDAKLIFVVLCLAAVCTAQLGFLRSFARKTPERIGNLILAVSQPGARIYKGAELRQPLSGGPPEPVEAGAFRWSAQGPLGGHAAVSYTAGKDGYSARFAYRARSEQLPPGVTQAPFPSPPPPAPPVPPLPPLPPVPPTTTPLLEVEEPVFAKAAARQDVFRKNPNTLYDGEEDGDERISAGLVASLVG